MMPYSFMGEVRRGEKGSEQPCSNTCSTVGAWNSLSSICLHYQMRILLPPRREEMYVEQMEKPLRSPVSLMMDTGHHRWPWPAEGLMVVPIATAFIFQTQGPPMLRTDHLWFHVTLKITDRGILTTRCDSRATEAQDYVTCQWSHQFLNVQDKIRSSPLPPKPMSLTASHTASVNLDPFLNPRKLKGLWICILQ